MATKFAPVVRLKKMAMEQAGAELAAVEREIRELTDRHYAVRRELDSLAMPHGGSFGLIRKHRALVDAVHRQEQAIALQLSFLTHRRESMREKVTQARIDFERFEFLDKQEESLAWEKKQRRDNLELDDLALLLHGRKG